MSTNLAARAAVAQIHQQFKLLDLDLPACYEDRLKEIRDKLDGWSPTNDRAALAHAVADALLAGKDPAKDTTVRSMLVAQQLQAANIGDAVHQAADDRRAAVLVEFAPRIIETLSVVVDEADTHLAAARDAIPNLDVFDVNFGATLKPAHMALWGHARASAARLDKVVMVWRLLANATGLSDVSGMINARPLILAELDADQLRMLGSRPTTDSVVAAGHRLSLATPDEFRRRVARVTEQRAKAEEQARQEDERYARTGRRYAAVTR